MKVLIVGGGGREHALALGLDRDPEVDALHAAPGNPGLATVADLHHVDVLDPAAVVALARRLTVDLVVVGPEAPLVAGVADALRSAGFACFGPDREAAAIEGSKAFAKEVMAAAGVPTAESRVCTTPAEVEAALARFGPPYVVKDDGLAAGKGVLVTPDPRAAADHAAGCSRVVIEEFLDGPEVSLFAICDGRTALPLQPAQDYKRLGDGDAGPNTGGMGAYSPLPWAPGDLVDGVSEAVIGPTLAELAGRRTPFVGLLYTGLALTAAGPRVVEFNARFGDPETQALLERLDTPLGWLLHAAACGRLSDVDQLRWRPDAAVSVVMAAAGYPGSPRTGDPVHGIAAAEALDGVRVHHAGIAFGGIRERELVTSGGRVLAVTGTGASLDVARERAYAGVAEISFSGAVYRHDIGSAVGSR
ncbi:MAG TPA: phosphoribosylamine--glycine ligase [Nocardioidaceae bacterium]|nr:phosphoribosylamine--glycine ligase [Nocardioidaceae bacterium]